MSPVIMGVQAPLYQDISNNMQQLQGTVIIQTNFIHVSVLNHIFMFSKILYSLMRNEKFESEQLVVYNLVEETNLKKKLRK
jgi:hypothetical protein